MNNTEPRHRVGLPIAEMPLWKPEITSIVDIRLNIRHSYNGIPLLLPVFKSHPKYGIQLIT